MVVGFAEIHAAAVSISQLVDFAVPVPPLARWGILAVLAASIVSKSALSFISGGKLWPQNDLGTLVIFDDNGACHCLHLKKFVFFLV